MWRGGGGWPNVPLNNHIKYALPRENLSSGFREKQSRRSACAPALPDQRLSLLFTNRKVSFLVLLQAKFKFSNWSRKLHRLV